MLYTVVPMGVNTSVQSEQRWQMNELMGICRKWIIPAPMPSTRSGSDIIAQHRSTSIHAAITSLPAIQRVRFHIDFEDGLVKEGRDKEYEKRKHCEFIIYF
jgi:hypothetical protein